MDLCNQWCLSGLPADQPPILTCKCFNQILLYLPCLLDPQTSSVYMTFSGLDLG